MHTMLSNQGTRNSDMIKAIDTDVHVIAIHVFTSLKEFGLEGLWLAFGTDVNLRWIPVYNLYSRLSQEKTNALPFFHALTGCDVVSAFRGKGKR
jgi:hypothetical protein